MNSRAPKKTLVLIAVLLSFLIPAPGKQQPGRNYTAPAAQPSSADAKSDTFVAAVWYSGGKARAPMLEPITPESPKLWKDDLLKIKALGFNAVRTWVEWNVAEPHEGDYHLENLDLLLKLADEVGLKVIVQVYVDSAPEWVGQKFPDGRYTAQDGQPIPSQAAPGYCFDNRGVRKAVLSFFQEVARHAIKSPAFYGWDLWSEPAALNWARIGYKSEPMFCYCPSSMERFRTWLQRKYGSIDALNQAWHRTFNEWSEVEPPRYGTILTYTDFMDWRVYYGYKLAEDLKMRSEAVKAIDPGHVTTSHAPNPSPLVRTLADPYDPTDDFLMKDSVDYFGTSFYPKLTAVEHNWTLERRVLAMDLTKDITGRRGFFVGELQGGYGIHGTVVGSPITSSDLELWTWGMVARGARSISYYAFYPMSAGYESGGYGLINLDGTITDRGRHAGKLASVITQNADLLLHAKPERSEVAIVFSPLVPLVGGYDEEGNRTAIHEAVAGYHRMFFERNIPVDVLSSRELGKDNLKTYKLIIVPYPLMMIADEASELKNYVAGGGRLFVEARAGWVDDTGKAQLRVPGFGWDLAFGVREKQVRPGQRFDIKWGKVTFPVSKLLEEFEVDRSARVVATAASGVPIAFESAFQSGKVIMFGSFAGQENYAHPIHMHPLGAILSRWASLTSPNLEISGVVELREMVAPKGRFVFFFNHGEKPAEVTFTRTLEKSAATIRELMTGETTPGTGTQLRLQTQVPAGAVRVYRIDFSNSRAAIGLNGQSTLRRY